MDIKKLFDPFPASDIGWRVGRSGVRDGKAWAKVLAFVDNRAIMDRLDEVCGPENWRNEFREWHGGSQLCGLSIRLGDEWVTKWDGAPDTDFEAVKGGLSDAMKRAAVQWGIGRYLYSIGESWANIHDKGSHFDSVKDKDGGKSVSFKWDPPDLPAWALPALPKATSPQQNGKTNGHAENGSGLDDAAKAKIHDTPTAKLPATIEAAFSRPMTTPKRIGIVREIVGSDHITHEQLNKVLRPKVEFGPFTDDEKVGLLQIISDRMTQLTPVPA